MKSAVVPDRSEHCGVRAGLRPGPRLFPLGSDHDLFHVSVEALPGLGTRLPPEQRRGEDRLGVNHSVQRKRPDLGSGVFGSYI